MNASSLPSPHQRRTALVVPVSALRRQGDLGIGDTSAVYELIDWAARYELGVLQFLPITECGRDGSPYSAISSVALEPTLLDVSPAALHDLTEQEYDEVLARLDLDGLNEGDIQFERVRQIKFDILWAAWEAFCQLDPEHERQLEFARFRSEEASWLDDYCQFRFVMDMEAGSELWDRWSEKWQSAEGIRQSIEEMLRSEREATTQSLRFYAYVQWLAACQWRLVAQFARQKQVWLMGDIPFGLSYYSCDVLFSPELFDRSWSGGAPPEEYFKDDEFVQKWGQNWGIPLYDWERMREQNYQWWTQRVRKTAEIMDAYRIDHVLGFYRIYGFPWRPERNGEVLQLAEHEVKLLTNGRLPGFQPRDDDSPENRQANCAEGHRRLQTLKHCSPQTAIVAEDLGTVPDYVRPDLGSLGIPGTVVPQWTHGEDGQLVDPAHYPPLSFAIYATHDHEPLRVLWERCQQARREQGEDCEEAGYIRALIQLLGWEGAEATRAYDEELRQGFLQVLLHSSSCYAGVMITDLFGLADRFNVPGTLGGRNWRVRMEHTVAEFEELPEYREKAERFAELARASGRALPS